MNRELDPETDFMLHKQHTLSAPEKASIKLNLLTHAAQSLAQSEQPVRSPWSSWFVQGSTAFAAIVLLFGGTAYGAHDSQPGEILYAIKVHVVEEMVGLTKISPSAQVSYDITRLETRLEELQLLQTTSDTATILELTEHINDHTNDALYTLHDTPDTSIPYPQRIDSLIRLSGVLAAQESESEKFTSFETARDDIQKTQHQVDDALHDTIDRFIAEEPETVVNEYLQDAITTLGAELYAGGTTTPSFSAAGQYLYDVEEALIDGDIDEALTAISEAEEILITDAYDTSSEALPGDQPAAP